MRSGRYFKRLAEPYVAAARAGNRRAKAMLKMAQMMCHSYLEAKRSGTDFNAPIYFKIEPKNPTRGHQREARRRAQEAGEDSYLGEPCRSCAGRERNTRSTRCITCETPR